MINRNLKPHPLQGLFAPKSVAVIGASNDLAKPGGIIVKNLKEIKFSGQIFPVNPHATEIQGLKSYSSIADIPDELELVIFILPANTVHVIGEQIEKRMAKQGDLKYLICAAAGYAETKTPAGIKRQEYLVALTQKYNIRLLGPNCIGIIDNINKLDTTFVETLMDRNQKTGGNLSFISQSGAVAASLLMWGASAPTPLDFNKFISVGNMADLDFIDLLEYLEQDQDTKVIALYLEGYQKAGQLIKIMGRIAKKKPLIVLKVGKSSAGASAANSHTGSLAGEDVIYDNLFQQFGIIRVDSFEELMDTMQAFSRLPLPQNKQAVILTQAGGPGIIATDALSETKRLALAKLEPQTKAKLKEALLSFAIICEPEGFIDITASATVEHHITALKLLLADKNVDSIIFITVIPSFLPQQELAQALAEVLALAQQQKPIFSVIMAGKWVMDLRKSLGAKGYLTFETPERGVKALFNMTLYQSFLKTGGN